MGKMSKFGLVRRLGDWLYKERPDTADCRIEYRDETESEFAVVEFANGETLERDVTGMSDWQTAAVVMTIIDAATVRGN